jgi:hypothetical protein
MNKRDYLRLSVLYDNVNTLMDVPPSMTPVMTNAEIIEAILGDIQRILANKDTKDVAALIDRDIYETSLRRPAHH